METQAQKINEDNPTQPIKIFLSDANKILEYCCSKQLGYAFRRKYAYETGLKVLAELRALIGTIEHFIFLADLQLEKCNDVKIWEPDKNVWETIDPAEHEKYLQLALDYFNGPPKSGDFHIVNIENLINTLYMENGTVPYDRNLNSHFRRKIEEK